MRRMKRLHLTAVLLCLAGGFALAQSEKQKPELFTSHFNPTKTPIFKSRIPPEVCAAIIRQADEILQSHNGNGFVDLDDHDLLVASDNLRACATTPAIARSDRDLAVGLYGEAVAERECRARGK